ncbi:putative phage tail protein [Paenibacillus elgii]
MKFFEFFQRILPIAFLNGPNTKGLYEAVAHQFDDLHAAIIEGQDQLFIDSATYMLPVYEAEFAIQRVDKSDALQDRRNNVMAMSRGGLGCTPEAILNVLKSYGYSCRINEDFANYQVTIQFTDVLGVPNNLGDLQSLMRRLIPAHLEVRYGFRYLTVAEVEGMTLAEIENTTMDKFAWG